MIYINAGDSGLNAGLGKAKILKKIQIKKIAKPIAKAAKQVSIKNVVKAVKFAAPIAAGLVPVGGGIASKLMDSKAGKAVSKVKASKIVKKAVAVSKASPVKAVTTQLKPAVNNAVQKKLTPVKAATPKKAKKSKKLAKGSKGAEVKKLQESLGVKPDGVFGPKTEAALQEATGAKTVSVDESYTAASQAIPSEATPSIVPETASTTAKTKVLAPEVLENTSEDMEPIGELTPVTPVNDFVAATSPTTEPKASNTMLYVGGAIAVAGIAYLATKKSK